MARRQTVARRYAEAAFDIGRGDGTLDAWERDLGRLAALLESPELRRFLEHPAIPFARKEAVMQQAAGQDVSREALALVLLMVRRGRPGAIGRMIEHFGDLLRRERGIALAYIRTALPLDDEQRRALQERLAALTGDSIEMREMVDEDLIGGIAVRIGDTLYDASVRSRLERLRARMTAV